MKNSFKAELNRFTKQLAGRCKMLTLDELESELVSLQAELINDPTKFGEAALEVVQTELRKKQKTS